MAPFSSSPGAQPIRLLPPPAPARLLLAIAASAFAGGALGAQELRYSITPTAEQVRWDGALGLENSILYGGRAGFVFGKHVELQGFYLTNEGSASNVRGLYDRLGIGSPPAGNPTLDVRNYGASFVFNFTAGGLTPFVRGGGSVLRFQPDGGRKSDQIALRYGGGLRFGKPGGLRLNVFADDMRFRVDRTLLVALPGGVPSAPDLDADKLRSNLVYGAGLSIPLGGAAVYDDRPEFALSNLSLPVELFGGRLDFADATGLGRQNIAGVRTGIDFGPLVSLRGYYWRGVSDDFDATQGVQSFGGEAQFNLNAGPGLSPFLIVGGGQIDFRPNYGQSVGDSALGSPRDRAALILGGGVRVPLGERLQLNLAARDYLLARDGALEDVRESGQLRSNWSFSAGIGFALGGARPDRATPRDRVATRRTTDTVYVDRETGRAVATPDAEGTKRDGATDTVVVTAAGDTLTGDAAARARRAAAGYASGRTVTVPVPTEGEIVLRYGPPRDRPRAATRMPARPGERPAEVTVETAGEVSPALRDDLRIAVREAVRDEMAAMMRNGQAPQLVPQYVPVPVYPQYPTTAPVTAPRVAPGAPAPQPPALTPSDARLRKEAADRLRGDSAVRAVEQRFMTRLDSIEARAGGTRPMPTGDDVRAIIRDELARERAEMAREAAALEAVRRREAERAASPAASTPPAQSGSRGVRGGTFYSGATFTGGGQALIGGRLDVAEITPAVPGLRLVPELAFGFGSGATSTYAAANALYEFGGIASGRLGRIRPRVAHGAGLLNLGDRASGRDGLSAVLTPSYGAALELPALRSVGGALGMPALLVEHQGVAMFDVNRLVIGLTWRR